MEALMAAKRNAGGDFESRFFDLLNDNFQSLKTDYNKLEKSNKQQDKKLNELVIQTTKTNSRVSTNEKRLDNQENPTGAKVESTALFKDPTVIKTIFIVSLIILVVISAIAGIDITRLL